MFYAIKIRNIIVRINHTVYLVRTSIKVSDQTHKHVLQIFLNSKHVVDPANHFNLSTRATRYLFHSVQHHVRVEDK
jgi:hypothetical protein